MNYLLDITKLRITSIRLSRFVVPENAKIEVTIAVQQIADGECQAGDGAGTFFPLTVQYGDFGGGFLLSCYEAIFNFFRRG